MEAFIETLIDLYDQGVSYVDLIGYPGDRVDKVGIYVKDEYMKYDFEETSSKLLNKKITDEDINQLLN